MINLALRKGIRDSDYPSLVSTAEAATLQLEFRYLSLLTENDEYWQKAETVCTSKRPEYLAYLQLRLGHASHQTSAYASRTCFYLHEVSQ